MVGQKIKKLRELRNFSQSYMADRLNMTQQNYSRIESDNDITYSRLKEIADVLEMKPEQILAFDEKFVFMVLQNHTINNNYGQVSLQELEVREEVAKLKKELDELKNFINQGLNKT